MNKLILSLSFLTLTILTIVSCEKKENDTPKKKKK